MRHLGIGEGFHGDTLAGIGTDRIYFLKRESKNRFLFLGHGSVLGFQVTVHHANHGELEERSTFVCGKQVIHADRVNQ